VFPHIRSREGERKEKGRGKRGGKGGKSSPTVNLLSQIAFRHMLTNLSAGRRREGGKNTIK